MSEDSVTSDERAAMRAFLQRAEVRLSTMHRVATALLSGAGILVLLPAVERDTVLQVLRALLVGPVSWSRGLLAVAVSASIVLSLTVLWFLIVELTRFYFHANHVVHDEGEVYTPRFTLTGIRLPEGELDAASDAEYAEVHRAERTVRLLVPGNARARATIDQRLSAYPGLVEDDGDPDLRRAEALFELAAARRRSLVEEVAKVEYGIVRHMFVTRDNKIAMALSGVSAIGLVDANPSPTERQIREWLEGNLCRCTGYHNIVKSIDAGAAAMRQGK